MIDGHGPTRGERRPKAPGDGSHSCAVSGPGLTRADPLPSSGTSVTGPAVAIRRTRPRTHHGHDPQSRTRRHPPDQPGYSCNPRPPVRSTPEVPYMSLGARFVNPWHVQGLNPPLVRDVQSTAALLQGASQTPLVRRPTVSSSRSALTGADVLWTLLQSGPWQPS